MLLPSFLAPALPRAASSSFEPYADRPIEAPSRVTAGRV